MSDPEEPLTLLDKATEVEFVSPPAKEDPFDTDAVYVRCPVSKVEDIAANIILSKLDKLRRVEQTIADESSCCEMCDAEILFKIKEILDEDSHA